MPRRSPSAARGIDTWEFEEKEEEDIEGVINFVLPCDGSKL